MEILESIISQFWFKSTKVFVFIKFYSLCFMHDKVNKPLKKQQRR